MITICITSCKKDNTNPTSTYSDEMILHSNKVLSLIKQFDEKMSSTLKSGEIIELDSAIWNTEALQNYTYAFPDSSTKAFIVFNSNYTLAVDANGMVWLSDVQVLNNQMEVDYQSNLNSLQSEVKLMHFCDVVLDSVEGNTAYISSISGFGTNPLPNIYWSFSDDDDWIWGTLGENLGNPPAGKCDGTHVGVSDGSNELEWRLNNPLTSPQPSGFTDLVTLQATYALFPGPNGEIRIYVDVLANPYNCLYNEDLEYYLYEADDIIYTYQPTGLRPTGKSFVSIEIIDDLELGLSNYIHRYEVTYGAPYTNPE